MSAMASQITGVTIVYTTVCSGTDQRKHQSSASLAFVSGIHRWIPYTMASNVETISITWWRHQMETFSALLDFRAGNSPATSEFLAQSPLTRSFDVLLDLRVNKRINKQWWGCWFETPQRPLWRHCNGWHHDEFFRVVWVALCNLMTLCISKLALRYLS